MLLDLTDDEKDVLLDLLIEGSDENRGRAARALARYGAPPNVVDATRALAETEIVYLGRPPLRIDLLRTIDGVSTARFVGSGISGGTVFSLDLRLVVISIVLNS